MAQTVPPPIGVSPRSGEKERRHREREDKHIKTDRGRSRAQVDHHDGEDLVDYIHERDRLPRPTLKHRESSREGRRRHEYRYYEPQSQQQQQQQQRGGRPPRARSAERRSKPPRSSRDANYDDRSAARPRRRMSMSAAVGDDDDDDDDDRRENRRRDTRGSGAGGRRRRVSFVDGNTGKKRSVAQNLGKAAITAGAFEAVRQRGKDGDNGGAWKRVATAALGAAAIDAAAAKVRGRDPRDRGKKETLGASLGGLVVEGLVHRIKT
ncbi:hypothetical protein N0V82_003318 [Gnomoniopsis sp. IMI 355080]|nr:hypothetical protein N0V82_003318 [Gnomoniopsis sp. IMI 355080]